jgi:hypothetical protein
MKDLHTLTNEQLDTIYERVFGYRAIEDGSTRDEVIEILSTWEQESGENIQSVIDDVRGISL